MSRELSEEDDYVSKDLSFQELSSPHKRGSTGCCMEYKEHFKYSQEFHFVTDIHSECFDKPQGVIDEQNGQIQHWGCSDSCASRI